MTKNPLLLTILTLSMQFAMGLAHLTKEQKKAIGMQIWQNEAGQKYDLLVFWNPKEAFPSLGIGHFIWYPAGTSGIYSQTFPQLLEYFKQQKIAIPDWLQKAHQQGGAPWPTYENFKQEIHNAQVQELRKLLFDTIDVQLDFIVKRLETAWQHISEHIAPLKRAQVTNNFKALSQTPAGLYALIDYLNFKGEGTNISERYHGKGWGLLQVLESMPSNIPVPKIVAAFAQAAQQLLKERVTNAPANKAHEQQWLAGWQQRINTYTSFIPK